MEFGKNESETKVKDSVQKVLQIFEQASLVVAFVGIGLWLSNFPTNEIILIVGILAFVCIYLVKGILFSHQNKLLNVSTKFGLMGIALIAVVLLFRCMFWEGYGVYLLGGILFLSLSILFQLVELKKIDLKQKINQQIVFFFFMAILAYSITPSQLFEFKYSEDVEMIRLYRRVQENPENEQFRKELEQRKQERKENRRVLRTPN